MVDHGLNSMAQCWDRVCLIALKLKPKRQGTPCHCKTKLKIFIFLSFQLLFMLLASLSTLPSTKWQAWMHFYWDPSIVMGSPFFRSERHGSPMVAFSWVLVYLLGIVTKLVTFWDLDWMILWFLLIPFWLLDLIGHHHLCHLLFADSSSLSLGHLRLVGQVLFQFYNHAIGHGDRTWPLFPSPFPNLSSLDAASIVRFTWPLFPWIMHKH